MTAVLVIEPSLLCRCKSATGVGSELLRRLIHDVIRRMFVKVNLTWILGALCTKCGSAILIMTA